MRTKLPFLTMAAFVAFAVPLQAGTILDASLTRLAIVKTHGDIVFVKADRSKDSLPTCHTNLSWDFVMPLISEQDKKLYAMLLVARSSQMTVSLSGTGTCDHFGSIETLMGIHL